MGNFTSLIIDINITWRLWLGIGLIAFMLITVQAFKTTKIDLSLIGLIFGPLVVIFFCI